MDDLWPWLQPVAGLLRPAKLRPRGLLRDRRVRVRSFSGTGLREPPARHRLRHRGGVRRRRHGGLLPVSSARHLLRADDHRLRPGVLVHRHQVAHRYRRRRRVAEHPAPRAGSRRGVRGTELQRRPFLFRGPRSRRSRRGFVAARPFAVRKGAAGGPAERGASALRRLQRLAVQMGGVLPVRGHSGAGGLAFLHGAAERVPRRHEPPRIRRDRHDDPDRRRIRQFLGSGRGSRGLFPGPRRARLRDRDLAALVRAGVHGDGAVQARRDRRRVAGARPSTSLRWRSATLRTNGEACANRSS